MDCEMSADTAQGPSPQNRNRFSRHWKRLLAITATLALAILVWEEILEYRLTAKRFGTVAAGQVYRSGQISKWMIEPTLRDYGIKVIVDLTGPQPHDEHQQAELTTAERLNIRHVRFPLGGDGTGDVNNYVGAIQAIDQAVKNGEPVLVHCASGAQRTGGVVGAWRLLMRDDPAESVRAEMLSYGASPEVFEYLDAHLGDMAQRLVAAGTLARRPDRIARVTSGQLQ